MPVRAFLVGIFAALALIAAGCGSSSKPGTANGATFAGDAAKLVPANAAAFAAIDSNLGSTQWQRVDAIVKTFTNGKSLVDTINAQLQSKGLSWASDVAPALGSEVDVASLPAQPKPEHVVFLHPTDSSKLNALVAKIGHGYSVQQINGWSVVADSTESFNAVRGVQSGQSLADSTNFQSAWNSVTGDVLAQTYVKPGDAKGPDWIAAAVRAETNALRVDAVVKPHGALPASAGSSMLGDVPSGAALAVSFRGSADLASKLSSLQLPAKLAQMLPIKQLAPLLADGGVVYARTNGLVPDLGIELAPKDPQAARTTIESLLKSPAAKALPFPLVVQVSNGKLVIADSAAAASAFRGGSKLVGDAAFKAALAKAGVPAQRTFLAYANVTQLAPFIPVAIQAVTGRAPDAQLSSTLSHVGDVVAWATQSAGREELHAWVETH